MNAQLVLHCDCASQIELESHLGFVGEHNWQLAIFNHAAINVGPLNGQLALACGRPCGFVNELHRTSTLERRGGQQDFTGKGELCRQDARAEHRETYLTHTVPVHEGTERGCRGCCRQETLSCVLHGSFRKASAPVHRFGSLSEALRGKVFIPNTASRNFEASIMSPALNTIVLPRGLSTPGR